VRPPGSHGAVLPADWGRARGAARARSRAWIPKLSAKARLGAIAVTVLVATLGGYLILRPAAPPSPHRASTGTAFLGTATCADWRSAGLERRRTIIGALGIAATRPDPENPGATLGVGQAYGLFQRVCSTPESGSALLYEAYNRAASFGSVRAGAGPASGALGHP
jgi:hypothetical protein